MQRYSAWLGKQRVSGSALDRWPVGALHASLNLSGSPPQVHLPLLWHWLYFLETPARDSLGRDGHARPGEFFPPVEQPRRMFVGARCKLSAPLRLGRPAQLVESICSCEPRQGRSGQMTLLTVEYRYSQDGRDCVLEERDFMYLPERKSQSVPASTTQLVPVPDAPLEMDIATDPVLLFKFSALTFNGHRIHYDGDYARRVEGYPGIVVHGPLTALLLAHLAGQQAGVLSEFSFQARAPLFGGDLLRLRGEPEGSRIMLKAYRPDGEVAMTAEAVH